MNLTDLSHLLRATTDELKRDNDLADLKEKFEVASRRRAKYFGRMNDPEYLKGPADSSNWRFRVARARYYHWGFVQSCVSSASLRLQEQ